MSASKACPFCGNPLVASGLVDHLGLIYVCSNDDCESVDARHNCASCGNPTAFVEIKAGEGEQATASWELRCFDPLCETALVR